MGFSKGRLFDLSVSPEAIVTKSIRRNAGVKLLARRSQESSVNARVGMSNKGTLIKPGQAQIHVGRNR